MEQVKAGVRQISLAELKSMGILREKDYKLEAADYTNVTEKSDVDIVPKYYTQIFVEALYQKSILISTAMPLNYSADGDTFYGWLASKLSNTGVQEGTALEGNEEKPTITKKTFTVIEYANAVAITNTLRRQTHLKDLRMKIRDLLAGWAVEKKEAYILTFLDAGVSNVRYGGGKANIYAITANDKIAATDLDRISTFLMNSNVKGYTAGEVAKITGIKEIPEPRAHAVEGGGYYIAVLHPFQVYDLGQDTDFKSAAVAAAQWEANKVFGMQFGGPVYIWKNVVVFGHSQVSFAVAGGGYTVKVAKGFVLGKTAYGFSVQGEGDGNIWLEAGMDYTRIDGIGVQLYYGGGIMDATRYAGVYTAATDISTL
jgi:N4-gp56 family major capsid protein